MDVQIYCFTNPVSRFKTKPGILEGKDRIFIFPGPGTVPNI